MEWEILRNGDWTVEKLKEILELIGDIKERWICLWFGERDFRIDVRDFRIDVRDLGFCDNTFEIERGLLS